MKWLESSGVSDHFVDMVIDGLLESGRTSVGDGKIFVRPVGQVVRIQTGDTDTAAVTPVMV